MPSERFINLPQDKKKRIIDAALKEFARVPFQEISINRIIQDAEISRGSFYQYFEDKTDLQTYLLSDFEDKISEKMQAYLKEKKGDMFQLFEDGVNFSVKIGMESPFINVCKNVFSQMEQCCGNHSRPFDIEDNGLFFKVMSVMKDEYYQNYEMEDIKIVWEMLIMMLKEAVVRIFIMNEPQEEVIQKYRKKTELINIGFKSKERTHV